MKEGDPYILYDPVFDRSRIVVNSHGGILSQRDAGC